MILITKTSTILIVALSLFTAEMFAGGWKYDIRGPDTNPLRAHAPGLSAVESLARDSSFRIRYQDLDAKKRKDLEKRYRAINDEFSRLVHEARYLADKLDGLQPGTRQYSEVLASLKAVNKRQSNIFREKEQLERQLFPCGMDYQRLYQSKFVLNVINDSNLRATVYGTDEKYGVFYGNVAPGSEAEFKLATDTLQRDSGVEAFLAKVVVSYPDGAVIPAAAGTRTTIKKYYRLVYPTKAPCITFYRLLLTDSDFSVSRAIPEQTGFSIYMNHTVYNGRVISGGARNDLTVYFMGNPKWPVTGELTAVKCPPHMNCIAVSQKFDSSSIKGRNAVVMKKAIFCYGLRKSESIPFEVRLKDSAGNTTAPSPVMLHCIVR